MPRISILWITMTGTLCPRRCTGNDRRSSPARTSWTRLSWLLGKRYRWAPSGRASTNGSRDSAPWSGQTAALSATFLNKRLAKKCVFTCYDSRVCSFENKKSNVLNLTHFTANSVRNAHANIQACTLHTCCIILHWSWGRFLGPPGTYLHCNETNISPWQRRS